MDIIYKTRSNQWTPSQKVSPSIVKRLYDNFPLSLQELGSIGWETLAKIIIRCKPQLRHYSEGLSLCAFAINYLNGNKENKLSYTILEKGMDCIKSLNENLLNGHIVPSSELREFLKIMIDVGIDVSKENVKKSLIEEDLLSIP